MKTMQEIVTKALKDLSKKSENWQTPFDVAYHIHRENTGSAEYDFVRAELRKLSESGKILTQWDEYPKYRVRETA